MSQIQTEAWVADIQEKLFKSNDFYLRSVDHSQYVAGIAVTVPQFNSDITITKNRSSWPVTATQRTDSYLNYTVDTWDFGSLFVNIEDENELSYDKRMSVLNQALATLKDTLTEQAIYDWSLGLPSASKIGTTGSSRATYGKGGATGNRKKLTLADIQKATAVLDNQKIPQTGRVMVITPNLYLDIKEAMTATYSNDLVSQTITNGIVGNIDNIAIYKVPNSVYFNATGTTLEVTTATGTTNSEFALIYHENLVSRAEGTKANRGIKVIYEVDNSAYMTDTVSGYVRAGFARLRKGITDGSEGAVLIYETIA